MTREPASAGSDTKATGGPKYCTTPCAEDAGRGTINGKNGAPRGGGKGPPCRFAPCGCCGPVQRLAYTREWVIPGCLDGPEGNLTALLDLEPQRAGGVTRRAEAERRTAEPLTRPVCGGYFWVFFCSGLIFPLISSSYYLYVLLALNYLMVSRIVEKFRFNVSRIVEK